MISYPKQDQQVQVWYNPKAAPLMPLHGKHGKVVIPGRGRPRNHGVEVDGVVYVVPAGNLRVPHE